MKDEIWDIYDKNRNIIGSIKRGQRFAKDQYHLVVHVCIINSKNQMLIQLRSPDKDNWCNKWDFSAGGAAIAGENSEQAIRRETFEELGIDINYNIERPALTINFDMDKESGFDDYYIINKDIEIKNISFNNKEIKELKWVNEKELLKMIDDDEFIDFQSSFISLIFALNRRRTTHKNTNIN